MVGNLQDTSENFRALLPLLASLPFGVSLLRSSFPLSSSPHFKPPSEPTAAEPPRFPSPCPMCRRPVPRCAGVSRPFLKFRFWSSVFGWGNFRDGVLCLLFKIGIWREGREKFGKRLLGFLWCRGVSWLVSPLQKTELENRVGKNFGSCSFGFLWWQRIFKRGWWMMFTGGVCVGVMNNAVFGTFKAIWGTFALFVCTW